MDEATEAVNLSFNTDLNTEHEVFEEVMKVQAKEIAEKVTAQQVLKTNDVFTQLSQEMHKTSVEKGFWEEPEWMDKIAGKLALVHSEVTEALEAMRKNKGADMVTEEFADIFIRCMDLHATLVEAEEATPDLFNVVLLKARANRDRPPKHGNRWG